MSQKNLVDEFKDKTTFFLFILENNIGRYTRILFYFFIILFLFDRSNQIPTNMNINIQKLGMLKKKKTTNKIIKLREV